MATCRLQFTTSPLSIPFSSSSSSPNPSRKRMIKAPPLRRIVKCKGGRGGTRFGGAEIPMMPMNPNDPFLKRIAHGLESDPNLLRTESHESTETVPSFLDLLLNPRSGPRPSPRASRTTQVSQNVQLRGRLSETMLDSRVIYIGTTLNPAVLQDVAYRVMLFNFVDSKSPIHIYMFCSGTTLDQEEQFSTESEGFALHDLLMETESKVYTVNLGLATGPASLILAAGTKGKRFALPCARAIIQQSQIPPTGLLPGSHAFVEAKEAILHREMYIELMALHTGNDEEFVADAVRRTHYMSADEAIKFGMIDKILLSADGKTRGIVEEDDDDE